MENNNNNNELKEERAGASISGSIGSKNVQVKISSKFKKPWSIDLKHTYKDGGYTVTRTHKKFDIGVSVTSCNMVLERAISRGDKISVVCQAYGETSKTGSRTF